MNGFSSPPWSGAADETSVSDPGKFADAERAIEAIAARGGGLIFDRKYTISREWGRVLRAKIRFAAAGIAGTTLVTCWSGADPSCGVKLAAEIENCGAQSGGC